MSDDEYFPTNAVGNSLAKLGWWMRDKVSSIATEISSALLEDLPEFREQLQREQHSACDQVVPGTHTDCIFRPCSVELERLLDDSRTYSEDPVDTDDFHQFHYTAEDVSVIRQIYPHVSAHIDEVSVDYTDQVWKRLLYRVRKLEQGFRQPVVVSEEYDAAEDMVVVHCAHPSQRPTACSTRRHSILIVDDNEGAELIEWS